MRRTLGPHALSLAFLAFFAIALAGQALAGWQDFNNEASAHDEESVSLGRYLVSSSFGQAVLENWQSEYLQFTLYIFATIWLIQKGSNESKKPGRAGRESAEQQLLGEHASPDSPRWAGVGGWRTALYSNSLLMVMGAIWIASWLAQSLAGRIVYNADQLDHQAPTVSWPTYVTTSDFWNRTLQNWQSEFLAVGSMVILSVYLRQRGSPESKPVGAPHSETASSG